MKPTGPPCSQNSRPVVNAWGRAFSQVNNRKTLTDGTLLGVLGPHGPNPAEELIAQLKNIY